MKTIHNVIFVLFASACTVSSAEPNTITAPPPAGQALNTKFGQLDSLRSENAILTERLKNSELKGKISSGSTSPQISLPSQNGPTMPVISPMNGRVSELPQNIVAVPTATVHMVSGIGNVLTAVISTSNGRRINGRIGTVIEGVGEIKSISNNEVIVLQKKRLISLPFFAETNQLQNQLHQTEIGAISSSGMK